MTFVHGHEFDAMSRRPLYGDVTQWLVDICEPPDSGVVADIGCGSGLATELLLERFGHVGTVVGIDPSEHELAIARLRLRDPRVRFVQGRAQDADSLTGPVDVAVLSNVMHQIPRGERAAVIAGCHRLLVPGGRCVLNTLFYEGAVLPETRPFYAHWLRATRDALRERGEDLVLARDRPTALETLTPRGHEELFVRAGFSRTGVREVVFTWSLRDWEALCTYSVFAEGATGVRDPGLASAALAQGLRITFERLGLTGVPRRWLFAWGVK
ncbi:class I SAM-dependent methyltransferase [Streptomyces niveiscabiei]|uniref:class I SAM-dependent methyltransferase n=1 Tax=Streptomyces niveiscabiei TaxID=164115 RepID=UPI0029B06A1C|nr:class I SAM-dependent methyltransferase [Streptomyces niveiscabiei]MDX3382462.1 class I SAM-dependent methyltransferase [Streptomyces niveiscabiei]